MLFRSSVADIMNAVGIAKGTLYHHFKSKEDILDGITERIHHSVIEQTKKMMDNNEKSVHEKMLQALLSLQVRDVGGVVILEAVHKPQNALMHHKMLQMLIKDVTPILAQIIEEGIEQGIFDTAYPYEAAELFITYGNVIFDDGFMKLTESEMMQKVTAFVYHMEKVLGTEKGAMQYVLKMFEN